MRLLCVSVLFGCAVLCIGPRTAAADYVIYYATVRCDAAQHTATITLGQSESEPRPPEPPESRRPNADPAMDQSFELQGASGPGDCHLTPEILLRAKVGEGRAMPYGMCGADPAIWLSIWVDQRRWLSGFRIAGNCAEEVLSKIMVTPDGIQTCTWPADSHDPETCTTKKAAELPADIDYNEFSAVAGQNPPGTVKVEYAEDMELCNAMVTRQDNEFGQPDWQIDVPKDAKGKLFTDYQAGLYEYSGGFTHDLFDIDNSGTPRMVYGFHPSNHANDADMYFLSPGVAVDQAWPKISEKMLYEGSAYIFPLSFGKCANHPCGPADDPEEGALGFRHYPIEIRFRYLHETPFVWRGASYFLLNSMDMDAEYLYAVLKPTPKGFDEICILNKVPEAY